MRTPIEHIMNDWNKCSNLTLAMNMEGDTSWRRKDADTSFQDTRNAASYRLVREVSSDCATRSRQDKSQAGSGSQFWTQKMVEQSSSSSVTRLSNGILYSQLRDRKPVLIATGNNWRHSRPHPCPHPCPLVWTGFKEPQQAENQLVFNSWKLLCRDVESTHYDGVMPAYL